MGKVLKYIIVIFLLSVIIGFVIGKCAPILFSNNDEYSEDNIEVKVENIEGNTTKVETAKESILETSSSDIKVSPNATLILEKEYKDCKHIVKNSAEIPIEMVNLTKDEISHKYNDWEIKEFSEDVVYLYKTVNGICGEHFLITSENNEILVYKLDEEYNKNIYKKTGISTEYLSEDDVEKLEDGIYVYGISELNSEIENFE